MSARKAYSTTRQREAKASHAASLRIWPVIALLPITVIGSVKATGFTEVLGVDTTVLSMAALLLVTGAAFIGSPRYPARALLPLGIFVLVVLLGVTRSYPGDYQTLKTRDFFLITLVIVACIPLLLRTLADLRGLLLVWLLSGSTIAVLVLAVGGSTSMEGREGIGDATLGPAYLIASGLLVGVAALGERILSPILVVPAILLSGVSLVSIGSRGPVLAVAVGAAAWLLLRGVWRGRTIVSLVLLSVAMVLGVNHASEWARTRIFVYQDPAREDLWLTAKTVFLESPLTGIGWGNFTEVSWTDYPHNLFLEVAAELGLLGLLGYCALVFVAAGRLWRNRSSADVRVLASVACLWMTMGMLSADLSSRYVWVALAACLVVPPAVCGELAEVESPDTGARTQSRAERVAPRAR